MDELLAYLRTYVGFRSIVGNEAVTRECLEWIRSEFLSRAALTCELGDVNGASYLVLQHHAPRVTWFAHVDVVDGNDSQFSLEIDGDRAIGRGVKDMKGAGLMLLLALRDAFAAGIDPRVTLVLTSDEEIGGGSISTLFERGVLRPSPVAYTPDNADDDSIAVEHKGAAWLRLVCKGRGTHGATPWLGENPVHDLVTALATLRERFPDGTENDWQVTVSPTMLSGGSTMNAVPSEVECILDVRYPSSQFRSSEEIMRHVQSLLPRNCTLLLREEGIPLSTDPTLPEIRRFTSIVRDVRGIDVPFRQQHGASDARFFGKHGVPAFLYGPIGGGLHANDEWVSISSLRDHLEINRRWLRALADSK